MEKKPKPKRVRLSTRIEPDILGRIKEIAVEDNRSVNYTLNRLLRETLQVEEK
jgi:hypothetical protein